MTAHHLMTAHHPQILKLNSSRQRIDHALLDAVVNLTEYLHALAFPQCAGRSASGPTPC